MFRYLLCLSALFVCVDCLVGFDLVCLGWLFVVCLLVLMLFLVWCIGLTPNSVVCMLWLSTFSVLIVRLG